jgi:hypothetical protein
MELYEHAITRQVIQSDNGLRSAIGRRTIRHPANAVSQRVPKRIDRNLRLPQNGSRIAQTAQLRPLSRAAGSSL